MKSSSSKGLRSAISGRYIIRGSRGKSASGSALTQFESGGGSYLNRSEVKRVEGALSRASEKTGAFTKSKR